MGRRYWTFAYPAESSRLKRVAIALQTAWHGLRSSSPLAHFRKVSPDLPAPLQALELPAQAKVLGTYLPKSPEAIEKFAVAFEFPQQVWRSDELCAALEAVGCQPQPLPFEVFLDQAQLFSLPGDPRFFLQVSGFGRIWLLIALPSELFMDDRPHVPHLSLPAGLQWESVGVAQRQMLIRGAPALAQLFDPWQAEAVAQGATVVGRIEADWGGLLCLTNTSPDLQQIQLQASRVKADEWLVSVVTFNQFERP